MIWKLILMVVFFGTYIYVIESLFGSKLDSISKSFYLLQLRKQGGWFRVFCLLLTAFMIAQAAEYESGWFFFSGAGAAFVGVATTYLDDITNEVHFIGAASLIIFAIVGLALMGHFISLGVLVISLIVLLMLRNMQRRVYIYEIIAFVTIIGEFFIVHFKQN